MSVQEEQTKLSDEKILNSPLVTLAIFAFNQEEFIQDAIGGALAQTYHPLEIILSDDCSSDRTYEIMSRTVADYSGPHNVILNRSLINMGTAAHVSNVFALSRGRIFIVAAGDDISNKERVERIVSAWRANGGGAALVHSAMIQFYDASGKERDRLRTKTDVGDQISSLDQFVGAWKMPAYAPTCAYSREIFELFPPLSGGSLIEDLPLMVRSLAIAKIIYIDEPLVRARKLAVSAGQGFSILQPQRWNRSIQSRTIALHDVIRDSALIGDAIDPRTTRALRREARRKIISHSQLIMDATAAPSFLVRIRMMFCLAFGKSISGGLKDRIKFGLVFSFPEFHAHYKRHREAQKDDA